MGPGDFGTLIHECLDRFGKNEAIASSADPREISDWLSAALDRFIDERYGPGAAPAVFVQAELARWLGESWGFGQVAFPGRGIAWDDWPAF